MGQYRGQYEPGRWLSAVKCGHTVGSHPKRADFSIYTKQRMLAT